MTGNEDKTIPPESTRPPLSAKSDDQENLGSPSKRSDLSLSDQDLLALTCLEDTDFGDYHLLEEIARGGMGVVYKARQKKLDRLCAVKMILSGRLAGEVEIERFYAEARAAANLNHPGIVPVYEVNEVNGQHFFSMEFVAGRSLQDEIDEGPLEPRRAAKLARQIALAISFAHEHSVIHRDLKPANVLIDKHGDAHITDFGLAKIKTTISDADEQGKALGTPGYMSPEQASGNIEFVDEISDVYSIGAILYCMLTGRPPFGDAPALDVMFQVLEKKPVEPSQINPRITRDIEAITLKCLQKKSELRFPSALDLAEDLTNFLVGKPVSALQTNEHDRWVKWCIREPWLATAVISMMIFGSCVIATAAINPNLISESFQSWTRSIVARGALVGMILTTTGFAIFQTIRSIRDRSGIHFGLIRVVTVIPVGFIGVSVVVALVRVILLLFSSDYDPFAAPVEVNPEEQDLGEAIKNGIRQLGDVK